MSDPFWTNVDNQLDRIEEVKPNSASYLIFLMNQYRTDYGMSDGEAFFEGSGGDRQLLDSLLEAGWKVKRMEAGYYYSAVHPETGDVITYIEGDVYRGDRMPVSAETIN